MHHDENNNPKDCLDLLAKIEASKEFASARLDKKLLRYLVESTLDGLSIKETTIAIDVFDKDTQFNPGEDSSVRSHIYTIRKKLDSYYANEGSNDHIRFVIPKGQYHVTFRKTSRFASFLSTRTSLHILWGSVAVVLLGLSLYLWLQLNNQAHTRIAKTSPIFQDFVESDLPTLVVIGDFYFYKIINFDYAEISRIACINSDAELDAYLRDNPEASRYMEQDDNSYIGENILYELPTILSELRGKSEIKINIASKINYNDLHENNIIYLGSLKSTGIIRNLMNDLNMRFSVCPHQIVFTSAEGDTTIYRTSFEFQQDFKFTDYAIVAKFPGTNDNHILIVSAFHAWDSGATVKKLIDVGFLKEVEKQFSLPEPFPEYFEMLFELNGYRRTSLTAKVLHFIERNAAE